MPMTSPLLAEIDQELSHLAPRGYMFGLHIRFSRPVRRVCTYPSRWIQTYTRRNLGIGDPMMIWCMLNEGAIRWGDLTRIAADPLDVMAQARHFGLTFGVAVAHGPVESRSYIGAAHDSRDFTDAEIDRMAHLLRTGHDHLDRATALRPILVEALEAIACGMTYDQACGALGISRTALRYRLQTARSALGTEDNAQAIRKAIDLGLMNSNTIAGISKGLPSGPEG
ncbi:autoinducer binding domain-containing protein [Paracoccus beibuensis]|uniref:autoinducer binding domain-containing protein n=1 Tax=Paracoccus beibuensis TaxID=547602 RepID=UPI0022400D6C|nr:autoinducer binding domain-containing protein [Paracoccus beibuensis]